MIIHYLIYLWDWFKFIEFSRRIGSGGGTGAQARGGVGAIGSGGGTGATGSGGGVGAIGSGGGTGATGSGGGVGAIGSGGGQGHRLRRWSRRNWLWWWHRGYRLRRWSRRNWLWWWYRATGSGGGVGAIGSGGGKELQVLEHF